MQTVFLGNMKKLFQPVKSDESFSMHLMENLRFSSLGLCKSQMKAPTPMDAFEITKYRHSLKNHYCKNNNINLLRIPYWEKENYKTLIKNKINNITLND